MGNAIRRERRAQQVRARYLRAKRDWLHEQEKKAAEIACKKALLEAAPDEKKEVPDEEERPSKAEEKKSGERRFQAVSAEQESRRLACQFCGAEFKTVSGRMSHERSGRCQKTME